MNKIDYTNQKFNNLTAIEFDVYKNNRTYWKFKCDCGKIKSIQVYKVKENYIKSCGCLRINKNSQVSFNHVLSNYKTQASKRGFNFELTNEEFKEITQRSCFYCGKIKTNNYKHRSSNYNFQYNGIDRVNNSLGYIISNCVACCKNCNKAKNDLTMTEFLEMITLIYEKHK